jgi:hypothetical protein
MLVAIFTKSLHLNGQKNFNMHRRKERATLQVSLYMLGALSFVGGRQGSRLSKYGGNGSIDKALLR